MKLSVLGRGVIGLTSAIRLLEAGHEVTIVARDDPARTTSRAAGAYWWPYRVFPLEKVRPWAKATLDEYREMADDPATGVRFHAHYRFCESPEPAHHCLDLLDQWEEVDGSLLGVDCPQTFRIELPLVDTTRYLPYLEGRFTAGGGRFETRDVQSLDDLRQGRDAVINCSGVWASKLVDDPELFPIRGQTVLVKTPPDLPGSVRVVDSGDNQILVLPRTDDCVLGGTAIADSWSLEPDEDRQRKIVEECATVFPQLADAEIVGETIGLRPGRSEVRLERDGDIVHNYGHGGAGFTVSWGCADDVVRLVES